MTIEPNGHRRVRLAGAVVQLQAFLDDGTTLEPIPLQPVTLTIAGLANLDLDGIVAQIEAQMEASP